MLTYVELLLEFVTLPLITGKSYPHAKQFPMSTVRIASTLQEIKGSKMKRGIYISRFQARRVLLELEKFRIVTLDFDRVPMIGQAFADEIFRVFHQKHPLIRLEPKDMNEAVTFMVERAKKDAL